MYRLYRRNLNAPRPLAVTILGIRSKRERSNGPVKSVVSVL